MKVIRLVRKPGKLEPPVQISVSNVFHVGIEMHKCKHCGGYVKFYWLFVIIHIPIVRRPTMQFVPETIPGPDGSQKPKP